MVDAGQVEQVVMNLVVNARDAMPGGGVLTLETARCSLAERPRAGRRRRRYNTLAVTDTGTGIDDADQGAPVRAVLHDEGARQGHRARACRR